MTIADENIKAAMSVAKDLAEGRLHPSDLDSEVEAVCRSLFGVVAGPDDPLFDLQLDVSRQMLAAGGIGADELTEWVAVARQRATGTPQGSGLPDMSADADSAVSGAHSPDIDSHDEINATPDTTGGQDNAE